MVFMPLSVDRKGLARFLKYTLVGGSTFSFDLFILWGMTELFHIPYYVSTPFAFLIAVSINYFIARRFVFKGTERAVHHGYLYFVGVAGGGAFLVTAAVAFLVQFFGLYYLVARILVACVMGTLNYLFNLHINFKVAGRHH